MDIIVGFSFGLFCGIVSYYVLAHKSELSFSIATIKEDLTSLQVKMDNLLHK